MNYKWETKIDVEKMKNKRILVAGGTGFIGTRLIYYFEKMNISATVITRRHIKNTRNIKYVYADLNDVSLLQSIRQGIEYDYLLYLAANIPLRGAKKEDYIDAYHTTLNPFLAFLDTFVCKGCKIIYISSVDVLGRCMHNNYDELEIPNCPTPYGLAKYCGEQYLENICKQRGANYISYRFSQVYGPNEPDVRIIPMLRKSLANNIEFTIYTTGEEKRRFLYVDDAVQAIFLGMHNENASGIYNIAGKEIVSILETIKYVEYVEQKKLRYSVQATVNGYDNVPSIKRAESVLGFSPEVDMQIGLKRVAEETTHG